MRDMINSILGYLRKEGGKRRRRGGGSAKAEGVEGGESYFQVEED